MNCFDQMYLAKHAEVDCMSRRVDLFICRVCSRCGTFSIVVERKTGWRGSLLWTVSFKDQEVALKPGLLPVFGEERMDSESALLLPNQCIETSKSQNAKA
jgi:hypothetical protein